MAAKFGPDQVVLPAGASDPGGTRPAGELFFNTTDGVFKYNDGNGWNKVSPVVPTISSISGTVYETVGGNITITGTGFLTDDCSVEFSGSFTTTSVNVTASSDTSLVVAVPAAAYASGGAVTVKVTNADNGQSGVSTFNVLALPSGGTITTSGNYRIHTFTSSGTLTIPSGFSASAEYVTVAGGGAGGGSANGLGGGGGGGAGGMLTGSTTLSSNLTVTIGGGGSGNSGSYGSNGGNTSVTGLTTCIGGGGGGGGRNDSNSNGRSGGSGGGRGYAGYSNNTGYGSGTSGQGNRGGAVSSTSASGGGGGGKGGVGNSNTGSGGGTGGTGGAGLASSITGSSVTYAAGGQGGDGANIAGAANTGNGGCGRYAAANGGKGMTGGSGVFIIRYIV